MHRSLPFSGKAIILACQGALFAYADSASIN
ncbi:hypothetical protein ACVLD2_001247 [Paenibacillus sp. PvR052]